LELTSDGICEGPNSNVNRKSPENQLVVFQNFVPLVKNSVFDLLHNLLREDKWAKTTNAFKEQCASLKDIVQD
jgi:hypothetical protein